MDELTPMFDTEDDLFNFESDHLALKGNKDYCEVLKTLVILNAQREKALKDYQKVSELKNEALKDPFETLNKLQNGIDLGVPPMFELPKLPNIDFQKFNVKVSESEINAIYEDTMKLEEKPEVKVVKKIRNWTPEEQKRLEELLLVYPPEPIERRRFQKIAAALGNKTVHQVASRVQKYFLKLYRAGLPIPGRVPKSVVKHKKSNLHKHQRHNHYLWKPTTFFPELNVPVQMDDLESIPGPSNLSIPSTARDDSNSNSTENYLLRSDYLQNSNSQTSITPKSENELQLDLLKRIRHEKSKEHVDGYVPFSHVGYKCDYCEEDPVIGSRWHCIVCPDSVDYCTDCVLAQMYSENAHPLTHFLAVYENDSENYLVPKDITESKSMFDKQITEELQSEGFAVEISDNEDDDDDESE